MMASGPAASQLLQTVSAVWSALLSWPCWVGVAHVVKCDSVCESINGAAAHGMRQQAITAGPVQQQHHHQQDTYLTARRC